MSMKDDNWEALEEYNEFFTALDNHPEFTLADIEWLRTMSLQAASVVSSEDLESEEPDLAQNDLRTAIATMRLPERVKLGIFGNATARGLLINDSNRLVQLAVLNNGKLQLGEVEAFAKNPNLSEQILRGIAGRRKWIKSYAVKVNLINNPKTPQDVSLKWLRYLQKTDLRKLARSKNVPQVISTNARKRLAEL